MGSRRLLWQLIPSDPGSLASFSKKRHFNDVSLFYIAAVDVLLVMTALL